jgi:Spy/CpxP family protein refolding chaperone
MKSIATKKMMTLTAAAAILLLAGSQALAQRGGGPHQRCGWGEGGFGPEARVERMAEALDLTEEQQQGIAAIQEKGRAANRELGKQLKRLENQLEGEMLKDDPSEKTVLELTRKMGDLRTEMRTNRVSNRFAVRALLTPEQRDKMLTLGARHGRGHGCGDCDGSCRGGPQRLGRGHGRGHGLHQGQDRDW